MFYRHDVRIRSILFNVQAHLEADWDYLLVICGDSGTGKSRLGLQLLETWYKDILRLKVDKSTARFMASDYKVWLNNFKFMSMFEMNIYDEGATTLDSKSHMTTISRDITKLYNVFRAKKFFSVIIIPSFFDLNKYFREKRVRGLIWVDKRGHYKYFSKLGIDFLNAYNERAIIKSMNRAKPFHQAGFPDYQGVMLKPYEDNKLETMNSVLDEVINGCNGDKRDKITLVDVYKDRVESLLKKGFTNKMLMEDLKIGGSTINRVKARLFEEGKYKP